MGVETKTSYVCDGCGKQSDKPNFEDATECGSGVLKLKWSLGGKGHDGAWGGISGDDEKLFCHSCVRKIRRYIWELSQ